MTVGRDKKIILLSGSGDTVAWFRLDFLNEFLLRSYKVYVLAPDIRDDLKPELINMGIEFIEIKLERKGFNLLNLISSVFELVRLFKEIQPNIIFSYTHKAILSGSLAAKISGFSNTYDKTVTRSGALMLFWFDEIGELDSQARNFLPFLLEYCPEPFEKMWQEDRM